MRELDSIEFYKRKLKNGRDLQLIKLDMYQKMKKKKNNQKTTLHQTCVGKCKQKIIITNDNNFGKIKMKIEKRKEFNYTVQKIYQQSKWA